MPRIAIDAMGGDHGPEEVVAAVARLSLDSDVEMVLVGDRQRVGPLLEAHPYDPGAISIRHSTSVVARTEPPGTALRARRDASVVVAARAVAGGEADAMVSLSPAPACLLVAARFWKRLRGIEKAAWAATLPRSSQAGQTIAPVLLLDIGATLRCGSDELVRFGSMGRAWAQTLMGIEAPTVGLLNVGTDPWQGGRSLVEAHRRLSAIGTIDFVGNIESYEVGSGRADVIVAEGLIGNIVVKLLERESAFPGDSEGQTDSPGWRGRVGRVIRPSHRIPPGSSDDRTVGALPLLGFQHLCLKVPADARAPGIGRAIEVASRAVESGAVAGLTRGLTELG